METVYSLFGYSPTSQNTTPSNNVTLASAEEDLETWEQVEKEKPSISAIKDRSFAQLFDRIPELKRQGTVLSTIIRPKNRVKIVIKEQLRPYLNKIATKARPQITKCVHKAMAGLCNLPLRVVAFVETVELPRNIVVNGLRKGIVQCFKRDHFTDKDMQQLSIQIPAPDPQTLVRWRQKAEKINRYCPVTKLIAWSLKVDLWALNAYYKWQYNEICFDLPDIDLQHLLVGTGQKEYRTPAERIYNFTIQSMGVGPNQAVAQLQNQQFGNHLSSLVMGDLSGLMTRILSETLQQTQKEWVALIQAGEGLVYRKIYDTIVKNIPDTNTIIREVPLHVALELFPFDAISKKGYSIGVLKLDLLQNVTRYAFGGGILGTAIQQILSLGLEFGPVMYGLVYKELDNWAAAGKGRMIELSSIGGWKRLVTGEEQQALQTVLEENESYLLPIISEFTLGTLKRMCQDPDLESKGLIGLIRAMMQKTVSDAVSNEKVEETPGLADVKAAFSILYARIKEVFFAELQKQILVELDKQHKGVKDAFSDTLQLQDDILKEQAQGIAAGLSYVGVTLKPETILTVTRSPGMVLEGVVNGTAYVANSAMSLFGGDQSKIKND